MYNSSVVLYNELIVQNNEANVEYITALYSATTGIVYCNAVKDLYNALGMMDYQLIPRTAKREIHIAKTWH